MIKKILLALVTIFIGGCDVKELEPPFKPDQEQMLANQIRHNVALQLKKEKELIPCGFGAGMVPHIWMLALSFNYYKEVDIEKARDLLVAAGSLFLKTINENEQARPYLKNYPFEAGNIEIRIFLYPKHVYPDSLIVISMIDGRLDYEIKHPEKEYGLKAIFSETYEEALEKHNKKEVPTIRL